MGPQRPAPPSAKPRGRRPQLAAACAALCFGCASTTTRAPGGDASAVDDAALDVLDATAEAPADATTDASRCDPSALADAGPFLDAPPPDGPYVVELSLEIIHSCARMSDGTARCRGANFFGQLGDGTTDSTSNRSARVAGLTGVEQIVAGPGWGCARLRDGTVRCWGWNRHGSLGVGHDGDENCATPEPFQPCRRLPTAVPGLTDVVHLAVSAVAVCAVRRDGTVWCWGGSHFPVDTGVQEHPTPVRMEGLRDVVRLRGLLGGWVVRHADGSHEVRRWSDRAPPIPTGATVAEGHNNRHICYRLPDSSVRCVGYNPNGKLGNGTSSYPDPVMEPVDPGLCGVRSIVTGAYHTCALLADRRVWCWGDTSTRDDDGDAGLERCVGINRQTACMTRPTLVEGLDQVVELFAGIWETCAIRADRSVWCWGGSGTRPERVEW